MEKTIETIEKVKKVRAKAVASDKQKYIEAIGRRKTAIARVRIYSGDNNPKVKGGILMVNGLNYTEYFKILRYQKSAVAPLQILKSTDKKVVAEARVVGGGVMAQAEAVKLGMARAFVKLDLGLRPALKSLGYLSRDARRVERKKYGLRKARRASQWKKR
jgi:small subunit ribosomal protein S9